jgi:hypothetical protein
LFGGAGIQQPSALFSVPGVRHPSPILDLTTVPTDASAFHQLSPVPTPGLASNISNNGMAGDVSAADDSGHDALSCMVNAMPIKEMATCKVDKKGRDKGVGNYSVQEHVNLLRIMSNNPSSFNASESSPEWKEVYVEMCKSHYTHWGSTPRLSSTLHAHVVEMYGALKKGVRQISLTPGAPKCPASYLEADDAELESYVTSL